MSEIKTPAPVDRLLWPNFDRWWLHHLRESDDITVLECVKKAFAAGRATAPDQDVLKPGVSHTAAIEAARRLIKGAFRRDGEDLSSKDRPRFSIPARPEQDDDLVLMAFLKQCRPPEQDVHVTATEREQFEDKIDGLQADLESAVEVAFNRGATEWVRLNYPTQYAALSTASPSPQDLSRGWTKVPEEPTLEFLKSINHDNQVLAYENGRYYNAWFEFEQCEGGWFWTDDADSEPNPSCYRALPDHLAAATEADQ